MSSLDFTKKISPLNMILAIVVALLFFFDPKAVAEQTITMRCLIFLGAIIVGYIGAFAGEVIRNIAKPDAIIVKGGMKDILLSKLFWAAGPQAIGAAAGGAFGAGIILKIFS